MDMWKKIKEFREEMDRRCDARALDPTLDFPFNLLMIDEGSQFSAQSKQLWRTLREKGDPAHPPVWEDVAAIMWQGAAFRCHVLLTGQRIDERVTGGIGLITSLGFRGLAGFRRQNWDRLIGTHPVPRSRSERGRWIYSDGESETWVQNVWGTDAEIKEYAMSGTWVDSPSGSPLTVVGAQHPGPTTAGESETRESDPALDLETATTSGVTWVIGNAAAASHVGITTEAFRKRRQDRGEIPGMYRKGNQPMWPATELDAWNRTWTRPTVSAS
jgi:hypothetical protein